MQKISHTSWVAKDTRWRTNYISLIAFHLLWPVLLYYGAWRETNTIWSYWNFSLKSSSYSALKAGFKQTWLCKGPCLTWLFVRDNDCFLTVLCLYTDSRMRAQQNRPLRKHPASTLPVAWIIFGKRTSSWGESDLQLHCNSWGGKRSVFSLASVA